MIRIDLILEKLQLTDVKLINHSSRTYAVILRNARAADLANEHIISVVTAEELKLSSMKMRGALFVIGSQFPIDRLEDTETVIFHEDTPINDLIEKVSKIILEHQRYREYVMKLDLLLQKSTDLIDIFNHFAEYYDNPVSFGDKSSNILLMGNMKEDFTEWDETIKFWIEKGYVPYNFSKQHGNMEGTVKVLSSPEPVLFTNRYASKYKRLSCRAINYNGQFTHWFSIVEVYSKYGYFDRDVLKYTADSVTVKFRSQFTDQIETPRSLILRKLINGSLKDRKSIEEQMKRCYMPITDCYMIVAIEFRKNEQFLGKEDHINTERNYFKNMLDNLSTFATNIVSGEDIILLLQARSAEEIKDSFNSLNTQFDHDSLILGSSSIYGDILETYVRYNEAILAKEIGPKIYSGRKDFSFQELYFEILFFLVNKQINIESFIVNGLIRLKELDEEKNTEFFNTLYEYILCGKNLVECSEKLMIHRNTAVYRINKAKEFVNIDFDNFDNLLRLYFSFKCIQVIDKVPVSDRILRSPDR